MTPAALQQIMPYAGDQARVFAAPLTAAMARWGIDSPRRQSAFLANVAVESEQLRVLVENLNYSAARLVAVWPREFSTMNDADPYAHNPQLLANRVYAERNGNGPAETGDGWTYRGRGLLQLTGRANYMACGLALGVPLVANPDLLIKPDHAAMAAAWFWHQRGCNDLADADRFASCCKKINGGYEDLDEREQFWVRGRETLDVRGAA